MTNTICPGCDGEGHVATQWAKEEMVRTGGRRLPLSNGHPGFHYVRGDGSPIGEKTVGGPCSVCGGAGVLSPDGSQLPNALDLYFGGGR